MGSNFHGEATYACYHGCFYGECAGHTFKLFSKHGAFYVEWPDGTRTDLPVDIAFIEAVASLLATSRPAN